MLLTTHLVDKTKYKKKPEPSSLLPPIQKGKFSQNFDSLTRKTKPKICIPKKWLFLKFKYFPISCTETKIKIEYKKRRRKQVAQTN